MSASESRREHAPAAISIRSLTRCITLDTPLPDDRAWIMLLIPEGSTDAQVIEWATKTLPPPAVVELRERIEREASGDQS